MALQDSGMREVGFRRAFSGQWIRERYRPDNTSSNYENERRLEELYAAFTAQREAREKPEASWKWQHHSVKEAKPLPWEVDQPPDPDPAHVEADDRGESSWEDTPASEVKAPVRRKRSPRKLSKLVTKRRYRRNA